MLVQVRTQDLDLAGAIRRHLERRVRGARGSQATRIASVTRGLFDINGPRGGEDLRCVVTVDLLPKGTVRAEATDSDVVSALGRALARARRTIRGDSRRESAAHAPASRGA